MFCRFQFNNNLIINNNIQSVPEIKYNIIIYYRDIYLPFTF